MQSMRDKMWETSAEPSEMNTCSDPSPSRQSNEKSYPSVSTTPQLVLKHPPSYLIHTPIRAINTENASF